MKRIIVAGIIFILMLIFGRYISEVPILFLLAAAFGLAILHGDY